MNSTYDEPNKPDGGSKNENGDREKPRSAARFRQGLSESSFIRPYGAEQFLG